MQTGFGTRFILKALAVEAMIFGIGCFQQPRMLGMEWTRERCLVALSGSILCLLLSSRASYGTMRAACASLFLVFGSVALAALACTTPLLIQPGLRRLGAGLLDYLPGRPRFGPNDHILYLILAAAFLLAAVLPKKWDDLPDRSRPERDEPADHARNSTAQPE